MYGAMVDRIEIQGIVGSFAGVVATGGLPELIFTILGTWGLVYDSPGGFPSLPAAQLDLPLAAHVAPFTTTFTPAMDGKVPHRAAAGWHDGNPQLPMIPSLHQAGTHHETLALTVHLTRGISDTVASSSWAASAAAAATAEELAEGAGVLAITDEPMEPSDQSPTHGQQQGSPASQSPSTHSSPSGPSQSTHSTRSACSPHSDSPSGSPPPGGGRRRIRAQSPYGGSPARELPSPTVEPSPTESGRSHDSPTQEHPFAEGPGSDHAAELPQGQGTPALAGASTAEAASTAASPLGTPGQPPIGTYVPAPPHNGPSHLPALGSTTADILKAVVLFQHPTYPDAVIASSHRYAAFLSTFLVAEAQATKTHSHLDTLQEVVTHSAGMANERERQLQQATQGLDQATQQHHDASHHLQHASTQLAAAAQAHAGALRAVTDMQRGLREVHLSYEVLLGQHHLHQPSA